MKRFFFITLGLLCLGTYADLNAQITYRGVAQKDTSKKSAKPAKPVKPVAQKKTDPKKPETAKSAATKKTPPTPAKSTAKKPTKPTLTRKEGPGRVLIFPKLLFPHIKADFVGFQTNLKKFVPTTVIFRLKRTRKPNVKIKDYPARIGRVVPSSNVSSKLEVVTPKNMPPGYYDIYVMDAAKRTVLINKDVLVAGIISTTQSFFASVVNGVINTYPLLTITGYGFGIASKTNYVYLNNMRLSTVLSWNDSVVKLTIPYWINTGNVYAISLKNNKGVEIPRKNTDPTLRVTFTYKGIKANYFSADLNAEDLANISGFGTIGNDANKDANNKNDKNNKSKSAPNGKLAQKKSDAKSQNKVQKMTLGSTMKENANQYLTILQIKGIGFGAQRNDSKVFMNSTECRDIVFWSDSLITVKTTALRPGKYVSKVFLHPNDRWKKNVFSSRDSFYVWGRIPYKLSRIMGASYAVSLRKSGLPSEQLTQKSTSYIYTLPQDARAELALYDVNGTNLYAKFFSSDKVQSKGRYKITYSSSDLTAGKYLLVFTVNQDKFMKVIHPLVIR